MEEAMKEAMRRLASRPRPARPWRDGRQIAWHDPALSERLLSVHLDPTTHMASRSPAIITEHVAWLQELLSAEPKPAGRPMHLLDLGCGPGLYALALARAGFRMTGIDFSPAATRHARNLAAADDLTTMIDILEMDLLRLPDDLPHELAPIDAITFWFGEFNVFEPAEALAMLRHLGCAVVKDGLLIIEHQPWDLFAREDGSSWEVAAGTVFADGPHLWLQEWAWDDEARAEITVHWILDLPTGRLDRHAQSHQAYTDEELIGLLGEAGFDRVSFHAPITGVDERYEFPMLVARKRE